VKRAAAALLVAAARALAWVAHLDWDTDDE
jgi:hypothetical protein